MFSGLRDTLRILLDVARGFHRTEREGSIPLVPADVVRKIERLERDLDIGPDTLSAAVSFLERLVAAAAEIVASAGPDRGTSLVGERFRAFLHRSSRRPFAHRRLGRLARGSDGSASKFGRHAASCWVDLDGVPTLRQVAALQESMLPLIDAISQDTGPRPANELGRDRARQRAIEWLTQLRQAVTRFRRNMLPSASRRWSKPLTNVTNSATWISRSCSTSLGTCSRSATTSAISAATTVSMICWHPRHAWRASHDCPGPGRPGTLVRAGPHADLDRRSDDAPELERLDVRIPDAAAGHAHL